MDYVRNNKTISTGIREDNVITQIKIPYQIKKYLNAENDQMKRYYYCYCPWVKGVIKKGEEKELREFLQL